MDYNWAKFSQISFKAKIHPFKGSTLSIYKIQKIIIDGLRRRMLNCCPPKNCYSLRFCFCLFGVYRPTREFFTHIQKSPLPVKGCKF